MLILLEWRYSEFEIHCIAHSRSVQYSEFEIHCIAHSMSVQYSEFEIHCIATQGVCNTVNLKFTVLPLKECAIQ